MAKKAENERIITLLDKLKHGRVVHIPHAIFPEEPNPPGGYWKGKICRTTNGGLTDIGVHIEGEPIFTRPKTEVVNWLVVVREFPVDFEEIIKDHSMILNYKERFEVLARYGFQASVFLWKTRAVSQ